MNPYLAGFIIFISFLLFSLLINVVIPREDVIFTMTEDKE